MSVFICLLGCCLVPAWDLDVEFLVWRSLMRLYIGGRFWRYSGGQGDLGAGESGSALPTQTAHNTHTSMLCLFSLHSLYLPLGCCLFKSDLEFVDYFFWIPLRKTIWMKSEFHKSFPCDVSSVEEEAVFWDNWNIVINHNCYIQFQVIPPNTVINLLYSHLVVPNWSNVSQKFTLVTVCSIILGVYINSEIDCDLIFLSWTLLERISK